jgi:hypothetical protein
MANRKPSTLPQIEDVDYNLEKWIDKWEFILDNDPELSKAAALLALRQLNDIVSHEFKQSSSFALNK